ncbi:cytochrome c oxidase subunit 8C, mitochondrial [Lampetra planeri]
MWWQLLAQRSGVRAAQVARVARRSCAHASGGGAQGGSVSAGEQAIALITLFATMLIPSSYIMANIKNYRDKGPE